MHKREDTMLSIRSMIERFRVTKPTSRQERDQARQKTKSELLFPVRDEESSAEKVVRRNLSKGRQRRLANHRQEKNIRWADVEPQSLSEEDTHTNSRHLSVDKLMSQDIQRFMATGVDKTNLSPRPPRVAPSIAPMSQPTQAVMEGYPRSSLVLPVGSERVPRGDSKKAMRGEDKYFELYLRDSLALDPNAYTGSAELRGEVTPASPQQHDKSSVRSQQLNLGPNENENRVNVFSAADVTADLDGVLEQLRSGTIHGQHVDPPGQQSPREKIPVNLTQIAHDLDAKLLEFTLMAKAREKVAEEARSAAEAEKNAWREGETKRVEEEVRQEHAMLHNIANREEAALHGVSEEIDIVSSRGHKTDWDSLPLRNLSARHPALPPSALGGFASLVSARTTAPVEIITTKMAGILRAVEAKVRRIEALEFDGSPHRLNEEAQNPKGGVVELLPKSPPGKRESPPCSMEEEDETADDMKGDFIKEADVEGNQPPVVFAPERIEVTAELDGTLATEGGTEVDPNACGTLPGSLLFSREIPVLPDAIHQPWLNGQTTLQQASQCIGAELEIAMLCMQNRLSKQPIVYGEEVLAAKVANQDVPVESPIPRLTEEPHKKAANAAKVGSKSEGLFQDNLQALADDMEARQEQNTRTEVDRELGLVFRRDRDLRWYDHESATYRPHLHCGGRAQDDGITLNNPGTAVGVGETFPTSPSFPYASKRAIWDVPGGEPRAPDTQVRAEEDIDGRHVPLVLAPGDGAFLRPSPPTPEQHLVPQHKTNHLMFAGQTAGQTARIGDLGVLGEKFQQRSSARHQHQHRHDEDGSGSAVTRARHRLHSFRAARHVVSMRVNSDHGHVNVPSQGAEDQRAMPTPRDGAKAMLGRLKEIRCSVLA